MTVWSGPVLYLVLVRTCTVSGPGPDLVMLLVWSGPGYVTGLVRTCTVCVWSGPVMYVSGPDLVNWVLSGPDLVNWVLSGPVL